MFELEQLLERKYKAYNKREFIATDPVAVPHLFSKKQDIEIAAFFAAVLAWGNRTSILRSCNRLMELMDRSPYDFVLQHKQADLKAMQNFVHRTFNATDLLYTISFLKQHYLANNSLEVAFSGIDTRQRLIAFHEYFCSMPNFPDRTRKHVATPQRNSACKRLNMFLRWMVRKDKHGVDFGIWKSIDMSELVCPLDVHVANVALRLGLLTNSKSNWTNAIVLTDQLRKFDAKDPVKYDYALFGLGVFEKFR